MLKNIVNRVLLLPFVYLLALPLNAAPATVISDSPLHQSPSIQSFVIANLISGTKVNTIKRSGGWKLITTTDNAKKSGWIRSYRVRYGSITIVKKEQSSGGFFSGLASLSRKASGLFSSQKKDYSFQSTATIGVRGLSEEEIKNAKPNLKQLKLLDSYKPSNKMTLAFAKQGRLKAISLSHLNQSKAEK